MAASFYHGALMVRRRVHILGMFVLLLIALFGLYALLFYTRDIQERTVSGEIREGMWGPFELERHLLLLRTQVERIRLGDRVSLNDYQQRREIALSRVIAVRDLSRGNPTFDETQLDLVAQIEETIALYKTIPSDTLPSAAVAEQILSLLDTVLEDAHDLLNIRRQVENLARDNAAKSVNTMTTILSVNFALFILVGIGFYWMAIRGARATEQTNRQLRAYAEQAEELATVKERNRIAREIHDGLGHNLSIIHTKLGAALSIFDHDQERSKVMLEQVEYLTEEALDDTRESVKALRTPINDKPTLVEAFSQLVEKSSDAGVPTRLRITGTPRALTDDIERCLYRVTQEALTNVRKHANASQVDVTIEYSPDGLIYLIVQDNGEGATMGEDGLGVVGAQGYGLRGIRERIEQLNGKIKFHSLVGKGFTVEIEVEA
jgi:signal transduction histidine kinase